MYDEFPNTARRNDLETSLSVELFCFMVPSRPLIEKELAVVRCHSPTTMGCLPSKDLEIRTLEERVRALEEENARLTSYLAETAHEEPPGERCSSLEIEPHGLRGSNLLEARPVSKGGCYRDDSGGDNVDDASAPKRDSQSIDIPVVSRELVEGEEDTGNANHANTASENGGLQQLIGDLTAHKKEIDANVISMLEESSKLETMLFTDGENIQTPYTALSGHVDEVTERREAMVELTKRNQELEADVASLAGEKATLASMLSLEKRKLTKRTKEATERRKKFESKLADMSDRLSDVLDDDHDDDIETSFESKADSDNATH